MKIQGAVIREQGVTFAIVIVNPSAMYCDSEAEKTLINIQTGIPVFAGLPLILASQDSNGEFRYWGRQDIVDLLASIPDPLSEIPWMEYTVY
jgi:hypothetical protein